MPRHLFGLPLPSLLESLCEFWDADLPRIGEPGARGWAQWVASGKPEPEAVPPSTIPSHKGSASDGYTSWASSEARGDIYLCLPAHTTATEDVDEDPYRSVLFDDISSSLFNLRSLEGQHAFRLVWLAFIGLPVPGISSLLGANMRECRWNATHLVTPSSLDNLLPTSTPEHRRVITSESHAGVTVGQERKFLSSFSPVKSWTYGLMPTLDIFFNYSSLWTREDVDSLNVDMLRSVFQQLRIGDPADVEWDILSLAFEATLDVKR